MIYEQNMVVNAKEAKINSEKNDYDKRAFDTIMKLIVEESNVGRYAIVVTSLSETNKNKLNELGYRIITESNNYKIIISWR